MQVVFCDCVRAWTKLGMAIAASRPMMTAKSMIFTRVKPELGEVLFFIFTYSLPFCYVLTHAQQQLHGVTVV